MNFLQRIICWILSRNIRRRNPLQVTEKWSGSALQLGEQCCAIRQFWVNGFTWDIPQKDDPHPWLPHNLFVADRRVLTKGRDFALIEIEYESR